MNDLKKIILTGYRATGKSSVGRLLAERLGVEFIDMDLVIEERYGRISQLVAEQGWEFFRAREKELLEEMVALKEGVVATGGGAIMHQNVWPALRETGLVVWLTSDLEHICRRLGEDPNSKEQRPSLTGGEIRAEAAAVMKEREPLYRQWSHLEIDSNRPLAEVVGDIEKILPAGRA